jgi:serine/threonine protein kinase
MHDDGWIHRDIKPENIFLTEQDEFRLGDFGLSINFDEEEPFHISGVQQSSRFVRCPASFAHAVSCHVHWGKLFTGWGMYPCCWLLNGRPD